MTRLLPSSVDGEAPPVHLQPGAADKTFNLFVIAVDGTGLVELTNGASDQSSAPDWSGDGWIYFASNTTGNYDIWRITAPAE